ncbi:flap endonuclease [Pseudomaricurvus alkylphenolicus]|uniref:5'-3' exonuclease H3TH domain-containing protein n=1 Tax=Pseudomaricurvus alkylphenolicus TaxID=1306991 RepID=UPI00141EFAD5|nr:flap endonuclease [Pseudomaricurvus alkylphenolicus]
MSRTQPVHLIDASIFIFRYYFSLPDQWFSEEELPTAAVYGYTRFLLRLLQEQRPAYVAACFDESLGSCFRNELYEDYKSSRVLPDEALAFQLEACSEVTSLLGVSAFASEVYEADDLLGSLAALFRAELPESEIAVLTRDKDLGQLLERKQDYLWEFGAREARPFYRQDLHAKFGVWPEQLVDYLALVGDSSDDIPGVPGIGAKTAAALLAFGGDLEGVFARLDELPDLAIRGSGKLPEKLTSYSDQIVMARSLAQIVTDIELFNEADQPLSIEDLRPQQRDRDAFAEFCRYMGFGTSMMGAFDRLEQASA